MTKQVDTIRAVSPPQTQESILLDQLVQEYLAWSAEALDVLVSLYEAIDTGSETPPEAEQFAARIATWEDRLSQVIERLKPPRRRRSIALV